MTRFRHTPHASLRLRVGAGLTAALWTLPAAAQTPAPTAVPTPAQNTTPSTTPGLTVPVVPPAPPGRAITLDQVVALAVNNNSNVLLAREKFEKSIVQIRQTTGQALPQISARIVDTYSGNATFATGASSVAAPTVATGSTIPVVIDQGGGNTGTFVGGGGGSSTGTSTTTTITSGSGSSTTGSGSTTTGSGAAGTGTTGTGAGGAGTGGTGAGAPGGAPGVGGAAGTGGTGGTSQAVPEVIQQYAQGAGGANAPAAAQPRQTTTGTGTTTTNGFSTNTGQHNNYSGQISLTQYIDLFGIVKSEQDVLNRTRDFYATDLDRIQNETAYSAKTQYFTVLKDQANVATQQEQVAYAQENVRIAQAKFTAGTAARFDVLSAQTSLANNIQSLEAARNTLDLDLANLNNLLGLPPDTALALQTPPLPPLDQKFDLLQNTQAAYGQRPELRQANSNIVIAKQLIRLAGTGLLPSVGVSGTANYAGPKPSGSSPQDTFAVTAQVSVPLYDGGVTQARVASARSDLRTQEITRGQLRLNVALEVRQASLNITNAQDQVASSTVGVTSAEESVRLAQIRYQTGVGTFLEVTNAEAQLAQARVNLFNAQFSYQNAVAQLTRAIGKR